MELLILMVSRRGTLISREEIIDKLWGRDVFVETEHGINTAVRKIRQTLRDDPENPRFIKTLKGRGYRFDAKIIRSEKTAGSDSGENESISTVSLDRNESDPTSSHLIPQEVTHYTALGVIGADGRRMRFGKFTAKSRWISVGATLLTLLCTIGIWRFARNRWDVPLPPIEVVPLVGLPVWSSSRFFARRQPGRLCSPGHGESRDLHDGGRGREVAAPNEQFWRLLSKVVTGWPTGRFPSPLRRGSCYLRDSSFWWY